MPPPIATPTQVLTWGPFQVLGAINTDHPAGGGPQNKLEAGDVQGDPFMDIIDNKFRCVYHGNGGLVYIEKDYADGDPLTNWSNPIIDPRTGQAGMLGQQSAEKAIPQEFQYSCRSLQRDNVDTPSLVARNGRYQLHYSSKPGVRVLRYPMGLGHVFCIQRATSERPGPRVGDWNIKPNAAVFEPQNAHFPQGGEPGTPMASWEREFHWVPEGETNPTWDGGVLEQSVLWDPDLGLFVMFYGGLTGSHRGPGPYRLGRAFSRDGETWWRDPEPSPTSFVWSTDQEDPTKWGSRSIPHHFAVTRAPDGVYHLAMLGADPWPGELSTQGIGHWYSTEKGTNRSWIADPNNPLIRWRDVWSLGSLAGSNNRLGSPNFFFDYQVGKVYLSFDGNGVSGPRSGRYTAGSRIYVAWAALPLPRWV